MKIGIVVYSESGNTLSVATKLEKALEEKKYDVKLEQITKEGSNDNRTNIVLENIPKVDNYDVIVFGAPIHGFSLAMEMQKYLEQIPTLEGKKVHCFVTHHFSAAWLGGNHSLKQMKSLCESKGAVLNKEGVINWSNKNRNKEIEDLVTLFTNNII